jgi:hypothetical protein
MGAQPQPITSVVKGRVPRFHFDIRPPKKNANLGLIVLSIINDHSRTDFCWSLILVDLLHADPETGNAMYQALTGADAKRAALRAAAKTRLSRDDFMLFEAVAAAAAAQRKRRNSFAHGTWGISKDIKDALLLAEPEMFINQQVRVKVINRLMAQTRSVIAPPELDLSRIVVYSRAALMEAKRESSVALKTVSRLSHALYASDGAAISDLVRRRLLRRPLVAQALRRLKRQINPKAWPQPKRESQKKNQ